MIGYIEIYYLDPTGTACRYISENVTDIGNDEVLIKVTNEDESEFCIPISRLVEIRGFKTKPSQVTKE